MSDPVKRAANCKYATPTLLQPDPQWFNADDAPWTCVRTSDPRLLIDTELCEDCPNWVAREKEAGPKEPEKD